MFLYSEAKSHKSCLEIYDLHYCKIEPGNLMLCTRARARGVESDTCTNNVAIKTLFLIS
jgi:hypothetical protein